MTIDKAYKKPIFLLAHPRACSTALERVFLTRENDITCIHEPVSDAYHWGPERLTDRYDDIEKRQQEGGYHDYTYRTALNLVEEAKKTGKRVFIKDMGKCFIPINGGSEPYIAPSLREQDAKDRASFSAPMVHNPTVFPQSIMSSFQFAFIIRHPRRSIPSLYECSVPPKSNLTGWHGFRGEDAGYIEMRMLFDYLRDIEQIGPGGEHPVCLVDADDLLTDPEDVVEQVCGLLGVDFTPDMLRWGDEKQQARAQQAFKNWEPFHDVVLDSKALEKRSKESMDVWPDEASWEAKHGKEAAALIKKHIELNMKHYLYLKQFAIKPQRRGE